MPGDVVVLHGFVAASWAAAAIVDGLLRYRLPGSPFVVLIAVWHALPANLLNAQGVQAGLPVSAACGGHP